MEYFEQLVRTALLETFDVVFNSPLKTIISAAAIFLITVFIYWAVKTLADVRDILFAAGAGIISTGVVFTGFFLLHLLFLTPKHAHDSQKGEIGDLNETIRAQKKEIDAKQKVLDERLPRLRGEILAITTAEALGAIGTTSKEKAQHVGIVLLAVNITNTGAPTVATHYKLTVNCGGKNIITNAVVADFLNEVNLVHEDSGVVEKPSPEDSLQKKTLQPIPTGGLAQGRIMFVLPEIALSDLRKIGAVYRIEFRDLWGTDYNAEMAYTSNEDVLLNFPGMQPLKPPPKPKTQ